jgi:hypothetical protein
MSETDKKRLARIRADGEAFGWAQAGVFGPPENDDLRWLLAQAEGRVKAEDRGQVLSVALSLMADCLEQAAADIDVMFPHDEQPVMQTDLRRGARKARSLVANAGETMDLPAVYAASERDREGAVNKARQAETDLAECRQQYESSQDALHETMGELRQVCEILGAPNSETSAIDLAKELRLSMDLSHATQEQLCRDLAACRQRLAASDTTGQVTECLVEIDGLRKRLEAAENRGGDIEHLQGVCIKLTNMRNEARRDEAACRASAEAAEALAVQQAAYAIRQQAQRAEAAEALAEEMAAAMGEIVVGLSGTNWGYWSGLDHAKVLLATDAAQAALRRREMEQAALAVVRALGIKHEGGVGCCRLVVIESW